MSSLLADIRFLENSMFLVLVSELSKKGYFSGPVEKPSSECFAHPDRYQKY
jgi:hypothetical protein